MIEKEYRYTAEDEKTEENQLWYDLQSIDKIKKFQEESK